jgi:hypothetical protein
MTPFDTEEYLEFRTVTFPWMREEYPIWGKSVLEAGPYIRADSTDRNSRDIPDKGAWDSSRARPCGIAKQKTKTI